MIEVFRTLNRLNMPTMIFHFLDVNRPLQQILVFFQTWKFATFDVPSQYSYIEINRVIQCDINCSAQCISFNWKSTL